MAVIGIDLGTSNSLVANWTADGPHLITNALGDELTPSAVSIAEDGTVLVGRPALDRLITHPDRSVASFKRLMGSDSTVSLAGRPYRAEELSALMLRQLAADAVAHLGEEVSEAIISVPAYFADPQRKATLDAARIAGLHVERLINEPTAAALAHGLESQDEGLFIVLDLGGGTFDVSLLHKYDGVMEVRASAGDSMLGGNDFRDVAVRMMLDGTAHSFATLKRAEQAMSIRQAEHVKHAFTDQESVDFSIILGGKPHDGTLTRPAFEEAAQHLLKRIRAPIERAVNDARIAPASIDQIVLVGGATRMPLVRQLATRLFGRFPLIHARPDHIIAMGAAVQAGLKSRHSALDDVVMTDVCPFSLGTAVLDGVNRQQVVTSVIIERNCTVPISRTGIYSTAHDGQTALRIDVLQGESLRPENNIRLGEVEVPVPPGPAGAESVTARYTYDVNGALEVEVTVQSTGVTRKKFFRNQMNLNEAELAARFAALAEIKMPARERAENYALIARAERLYEERLGELREQIKLMLIQFHERIERGDAREQARARAEFVNLLDQIDQSVF